MSWRTEKRMLLQPEILENWQRGKCESHFYRLTSKVEVAFEYRGPQFGHPSNYAAITILAMPSTEFNLDWGVTGPPSSLDPTYSRRLLIAIGRSAIDELFAATWDSYRGCSLVVQKIGWDDVMSSEVAFYRAARGALSELRRVGSWELVT